MAAASPAEPRPPHFYPTVLVASTLAAVAGYINALTMTSALHVGTTHMTGISTRIPVDFLAGHASDLLLDLALLLAFVAGASVSGALLDSTRAGLGRRYGILLMIEAAILSLNLALPADRFIAGLVPLALAAGLQNGMATTYSRAVVRTTHMTGVLTDIGIALGKAIARRGVTRWRLGLYLALWTGFITGGLLGALAQARFGQPAILAPIVLTGTGGFLYFVIRVTQLRHPAPRQ